MGLSLAAALTGCGGGGGGPSAPDPSSTPGPSSTPQPTPTAPPAGSCDFTTYTPNYAAEINLLLHWPRFPLRVFFARGAEYSPTRQQHVQAGFDEWTAATNGRTSYTVVTDPAQADVTVTFETYDNGQKLGETTVSYRGRTIVKASMRLLFTGNAATDQLTAAHEWGHALGIMDHSSNPADLMNAFGNPNGCGCVTTRDLNTLLTAYCNDFGPRTLPRDRRQLGPLRTIVIE